MLLQGCHAVRDLSLLVSVSSYVQLVPRECVKCCPTIPRTELVGTDTKPLP